MGFEFLRWRGKNAKKGGYKKIQGRELKRRCLAMITRPGCNASRRIANRLFKASQIPDLPLQGCKNRTCTCELVQLNSRRVGVDRRSGREHRSTIRFADDRRSGVERRKCGADVWKKGRYI